MSIVCRRTGGSGPWLHFFAIGVCVVLTLVWLTFAFVAGSVSSAKAAGEPPPTTTAPEPEPAPDPAPAPTPKPKPKPKPARAPSRSQPVYHPRTTSGTPTRSTQPQSVLPSRPAVRVSPRKASPKKRAVHPKRKPHKSPTPIPQIVQPKHVSSGVLGAQTASVAKSGGQFDYEFLVIVATLALAIACFGIAAIPVMHVPWYQAASFVAQRRVDVTLLGLAFLLLAGLMLLLTHGT